MQVCYDFSNQQDAHCMRYANFLMEEALQEGWMPEPDTWQEKYENEAAICSSWVRHYSDRMDDADKMLSTLYQIWSLEEHEGLPMAKHLARKAICDWEMSIGVRPAK
jgi:hypothetical protein